MNIVKKLKMHIANTRLWTRLFEDEKYRAMLEAIGYGVQSLLMTDDEGQMRQMIRMEDAYLLTVIGEDTPLTDFADIPDEVLADRRNLVIPRKDIIGVDIGADIADEHSGLIEYAAVKLRWKRQIKGKHGVKTKYQSLLLVLTQCQSLKKRHENLCHRFNIKFNI